MRQKSPRANAGGTSLINRHNRRAKAKPRLADHRLRIELEREDDGRWLAAVAELPGVMAYGTTSREATLRAEQVALRVLLDKLEHGEDAQDLERIFSVVQ